METHIIVCAVKKKEKEVTLQVGENMLGTMCLYPSKNNNLVHIGGTYGETGLFTGAYHATISAALPKVSKPEEYPLAKDLMKQFIDEDWGMDKKKGYGLERHYYPIPYELEDGSFGMANEFRKVDVDVVTGMGANATTSTHTHIIVGSILNIRIADGKCIASRIPKHRNSAGRTVGDSYFSYPYHNTMVFLYADNEKNLSKPLSDQPGSSDVYTNSVLIAASVDSAGNVKREKLIDKKDDDFLPVADQATYIPGTNNLYIPVQKIRKLGGIGKEAMWAKVEIN